MAVEPEKAQTGSHERRRDHGKLARIGIKWNLEVFRDAKIPGRVGKQCIGEGNRDRAADGEAIQPVRQIDCVGRAHDDEREKDEGQPPHIRDDGSLKERQIERARLDFDERVGQENRRDDSRESDLKDQFEPAADAI